MKYLFLISFFISFNFSFGQEKIFDGKNFYSIGLGYNFPSGIGRFGQATDNSDGTRTYTSVPGSYGKGGNIYCTRGYMIHPNIGLEVAFSYSIGGGTKVKNYIIMDTIPNPYNDAQEINYRANMFRINPSLIFTIPFQKMSPYMKVGLAYGWAVANWEIHDDVTYTSGAKVVGDLVWRVTGGNSLGINSSIGVLFKTNDQTVDFFVELNHISQGVYFKRGELSKYMINGKDNLSFLNTSQKEFVYVDSETEDKLTRTNPNHDPSKPSEYLKFRSNFNSIGLNIGFVFRVK